MWYRVQLVGHIQNMEFCFSTNLTCASATAEQPPSWMLILSRRNPTSWRPTTMMIGVAPTHLRSSTSDSQSPSFSHSQSRGRALTAYMTVRDNHHVHRCTRFVHDETQRPCPAVRNQREHGGEGAGPVRAIEGGLFKSCMHR